MRRERVGRPSPLQVELKALLPCDLRHASVRGAGLLDREPVLCHQPLLDREFGVERSGGVELETSVDDLYRVPVVEAGEGLFEPLPSDVAPGTDDVAPDLDLHWMREVPGSDNWSPVTWEGRPSP
jgi:hypothetical protein